MDYKNFSAIYDALCLSEKEVKSQAAVAAILLAKQRVTVMFTKLFPSTLADVVKRPTFDTKVFFPIIAKYPEVLRGNEEKFLHLLDALGRYQKGEKKPKAEYAITMDVFAILNSVLIDDYLWKDPNNRKAVILSAALQAVIPLMKDNYSDPCVYALLSEKLPVWQKGYPEVAEGFENITGYVHSETWF